MNDDTRRENKPVRRNPSILPSQGQGDSGEKHQRLLEAAQNYMVRREVYFNRIRGEKRLVDPRYL